MPEPTIADLEEVLAARYPVEMPIVQAVLALLAGNCGGGFQFPEWPVSDDVSVGDEDASHMRELARAIASGDIIPGSGLRSPLVQRLQEQVRAGTAGGCPSAGEVALLRSFIDRLDVTPAKDCLPAALVRFDQIYGAIAGDLQVQPDAQRSSLRYLGLVNASNAGACGEALERQRQALFKAVNSVSLGAEIHRPQAVDAAGLLYRIDIRDYGWDRPIDLRDEGQVDFSDGWLAIVDGAGEYAVEFKGDSADLAKRETQTAVPFLPADAFVQASMSGDLYSTLVGVRASLFDTALALGVSFGTSADAPLASASIPTQYGGNTWVTRFAQATAERAFWVSERTDSSTLTRPSTFQGGLAIFTLPNGLHAYAVAASSGVRLAEAPIGVVGIQPPATGGVVGAGCQGCHARGLIPIGDGGDIDALIARDSDQYIDWLDVAGVPLSAQDSVAAMFFGFQLAPLRVPTVAAELGIPQAELRDLLGQLGPQLDPLRDAGGFVDRDVLGSVYRRALCVTHTDSVNVPVNCDLP